LVLIAGSLDQDFNQKKEHVDMTYKPLIVSLLAGVLLCLAGCVTAELNPPSETKHVLFLAGGRSHGPGSHEHRAGSILLADDLNKSGLGIKASVVDKWPESNDDFDGVDVAVIYADAAGKYSAEQYAFLDEKVKAGMGIMFIHYGTHPSAEVGQQYFIPWIGGYFETGWSVNPHWNADLSPRKNHPIGNGIKKPFLVNDEFYYNIRFPENCKADCESCYPLITSPVTEDRMTIYNNLWNEHGDALFGKDVALMWCSDAKDRGRGVGFTGGHFHRNWAIDDFRTVVLNAIAWVARVDVPKNGVPSDKVTAEELNKNLDGVPKEPLTVPTEEEFRARKAQPRPPDPANYDPKAYRAWRLQKEEAGK
jgi:type 1 glutamine amidotransferase